MERLNRAEKPVAAEEWAGLEQQVRAAITMTPKLKPFGDTTLSSIASRRVESTRLPESKAVSEPVAVEVKHSKTAGAPLCRRGVGEFPHLPQWRRDPAAQVAKTAETARASVQKKWFGRILEEWTPKCDIYLHATADVYSRETGQPGSIPGHATWALGASASSCASCICASIVRRC